MITKSPVLWFTHHYLLHCKFPYFHYINAICYLHFHAAHSVAYSSWLSSTIEKQNYKLNLVYVNVFLDNNLLLVLHALNIVSLSSSTLQETSSLATPLTNSQAIALLISQMIYHCGGKPERTMHCCHGTQAMDNNRICHRLLFNERGKQYFM